MHSLYYKIQELKQDIFDINTHINISFEFFPPKGFSHNNNFLSTIKKLSIFNPSFISVTCTAEKNAVYDYTYNAIKSIPIDLNLNIAPHITYVNSSIDEIKILAKKYWNNGIRSIIALRGDYKNIINAPTVYAYQLVKILKDVADFDISVAAYPEVHPESKNAKLDLIYLKKKIDCGANRAITQFFFHPDQYLRFRDRCVNFNINTDIIPGILPIINFNQLKRFIKMTNVKIPLWMKTVFNNVNPNDHNINEMIGLIISVNIIKKLCQEGINSFHFYTLNHVDITYAICSILKFNYKN